MERCWIARGTGSALRKRDYIIVASLAVLLIAWALIWRALYSQPGKHFVIMCDNTEIFEGNLEDDSYIAVDAGTAVVLKDKDEARNYLDNDKHPDATNIIVVENGAAEVIAADCPDKICVNSQPVSDVGNSIVCMPNKVAVTIRN